MIRIEHLSKVFRTEEVETTALNDVSLHVKQGEFVAIMGPSGCGKSTLLNIIGLLDNPTSGNYYFNGQEVGHLKEKQRTQVRKGNIGFVFQSFNLIDELNVYENVELPLIYLKKKASEKKELVTSILDRMNISHRVKHFPQQLSGGQQQRVAIARMLMQNTPIKIFDDSLSAVDMETDAKIREAIQHQVTGTTIIIAHRITTLMNADCIAVMDKGRVVQLGTHEQLLQKDGIYRRIYEAQGLGDGKEESF